MLDVPLEAPFQLSRHKPAWQAYAVSQRCYSACNIGRAPALCNRVSHKGSSPLMLRLQTKHGRKEMADRESEVSDSGCNTPPEHTALSIEPWPTLKHLSFFPLSNRMTAISHIVLFLAHLVPKVSRGPSNCSRIRRRNGGSEVGRLKTD